MEVLVRGLLALVWIGAAPFIFTPVFKLMFIFVYALGGDVYASQEISLIACVLMFLTVIPIILESKWSKKK